MRSTLYALCAGVLASLAAMGTARANSIQNGDFSEGINYWDVLGTFGGAVAEPSGDERLHVSASNTYGYSQARPEWAMQGDPSYVDIQQVVLGGATADMKALSFSVWLDVAGSPEGNEYASLRVDVVATPAGHDADVVGSINLPAITAGRYTVRLNGIGSMPPGTTTVISIFAASDVDTDILDALPAPPSGQGAFTVSVNGYLDDFAFSSRQLEEDFLFEPFTGVIPEPGTMAALLMGLSSLGAYLRRRR